MQIETMIAKKRGDCYGCAACANICPKNAIKMVRDAEGFAYPKINHDLCIECGQCDKICPSWNFVKRYADKFPLVFAAINPDEKILRHSSSGGIFTALSEIILNEGGIVFGAGFDKKFHVVHTAARTLDELENLRGSKYVQSQIGDVYRQVQDALRSTKVLFSGTPCQCVGLKHFLGKDYDNLLTVEIICHGTPSPAVWEYYIGTMSDEHEVVHVNFRTKRKNWGSSNIEVTFKDRGYYSNANTSDIYGKLFLRNISLRPSCHRCKFRFPNGQSDLTLGDAWGVKDFAPKMFDTRGTSLVVLHTAKGKDFFDKLNIIKEQVDFSAAVKKNSSFITPTLSDTRRKDFFKDMAQNKDTLAVMQKYFYQDDTELLKELRKKSKVAYDKKYNAIVESIRKNFKQNILVITPPLDDEAFGFFEDFFKQSFTDCGVYLLRFQEKGKLICKETFSALNFPIKEATDALNAFVKEYNITEVYTEDSPKFNSPAVLEWIKVCGLPTQTFSLHE